MNILSNILCGLKFNFFFIHVHIYMKPKNIGVMEGRKMEDSQMFGNFPIINH